jgi:hypothetical protein
MACINPNNPIFQNLAKKLGSYMLAEIEFSKLQNEDFVIQNSGTFLNTSEETKKEIFENYVNLMDRKREGKSLPFDKFETMFNNLQIFKHKNTYILGEWDPKNNVFKGRLISSPGVRELFSALDVLFANVDFVASVPSDIGSMLEKKGLYKLNVGKEYDFKGEEMVKNLYFSSKELVKKVFKTSPEKVTLEQVKKYDEFFNYWGLISKLKNAYESKNFNEILPLLQEIGIYDYNAYKLVRKIKSFKDDFTKEEKERFSSLPAETILSSRDKQRKQRYDKYISEIKNIVPQIIEKSAINKVNIDNTDLFNNPKIYEDLNNELNKTLAKYLSKFGIKTEVLEDIQDKLGIDSFAHVDILNKILYVDKNNQENYPQQVGKVIAYMMQNNPYLQEVTSRMKKLSLFKGLNNEDLFEAVGDLISQELYKKTNTELPKDLLESIKILIKQFFDFLNNIQIARINKNIGFIADNILIQNQSLITQSVYKPGSSGKEVSKISLEEALKSDAFGNSIVEKMAKYFILTGSITLSEQGTVYRPNENQIHDLDWVSALSKEESVKIFNQLYPNNIYIRNISNKDYQTDTWLIAPEGYKIENLRIDTSKKVFKNGKEVGSTNKIIGYDIVDSNGDIVSSYIPLEDSHTGEIQAKLIDIFTYTTVTEEKTLNKEITLKSGTKLRIADWRNTFAAKLEFGRLKDIWDYNRFIPYDNIYKKEVDESKLDSEKLSEPKRTFADYSNFGKTLSDKEVISLKEEGNKVTPKEFLESITPTNDFEKKLKSFLLSIDLNKLNGFDFVINDNYQGSVIGLNERKLFEKPTVIFNSRATNQPSRYKLHEFLHSLLDTTVNEEQEFRTELINLYDYIKTLPGFKNEYGIIGWWEFYTEGMTNPDFQAKLKAVTLSGYKGGEKSSVYKEFLNIINNILEKLGFVNKDYSALDEIINATTKVIEKKYSYEVKPGIEELFDSNPKLANQVYEALGFDSNKNLDVRNSIVKAYKDKTTIELPLTLLESLTEFDRAANPNRIVPAQLGEKDKLNPFDNIKEMTSRENIDRIKESITKNGFNGYLEISLNSKGALALTEGNHRLQALKELGYTNVPVKVLGRNTVEGEYFQMIENGKTRQYGLNLNKDFNNQITPEQKQQALQLYSQYLDTIFPNSKVKDIVYHGTKKEFDKFDKSKLGSNLGYLSSDTKKGFYFGTLKEAKQYGFVYSAEEGKQRIVSSILNIKNPKIVTSEEYVKIANKYADDKNVARRQEPRNFESKLVNPLIDLALKNNNDGLVLEDIFDATKGTQQLVFEPEQIHILGSKQDIEGFKEFVGESEQTVENYRAQEQEELSQRIPNIENYKVNGKVDKSLITDENDLEIYNEIYDKYDALITPLLEASEESEEQVENTDSLEELLDNEKLDFQDAILIDLINKVAPNQESLPTTEEVVEELPLQQSIDGQKQNNSYSDLVSTIKGLMNTLGIKIVKAEAIYLKQQEINTLYDKLASSKSDTEKQSIQKQIDELKREGVRKNVLGLADTLNGVINLALSENNIDESEFALNEEMLHFIVDIIEQKYPDLYKELLQKVGTYNLYNQMYGVYAPQKEYQNKDGSVNVNKIKKEAVAKVLNDFLSNPEYSEEDYQLSKTQNLWNKIKDTLKNFFEEKSNNVAANNFRFTLDKLLNDPNFITKEDAKLLSGEEFFGIMGTISSWTGNKMMGKESAFNTKKFVSSADFVKDILEQKNNVSKTYVDKNTGKLSNPSDPNSTERYAVRTPTGIVVVKSRVSDFVAKFLEKIFPNSSSKNNKELELAAERGVIIHNIFELTFAKYVDPATGIVRKQPINSSPQLETYEKKYAKDGELSMTEKADKYVKELIALNPNSYFLTEIPIFNKSLTVGGTIDLMIIDANKKVHIYDWKTKKADIHKGQGIIQKREKIDPWNIKAWRIQLDSYMDILKNNYGVESFGKVRMIPIMTEFETNGTTISNINVGSEKSPDIRQRQLLAVPSKQELTGLSETDKLIKANYGLAEKLQNKANKVSDISEKEKLRLQSSVLEDLATDLQVGKGIQSLVNKLEQILKIHDDIIEKDRNGEIKGSDLPIIASAIVDLSIYASDNRLANVAGELFSRFKDLTDLQKETKKELESLSVQVSNKVAELKKVLINSAEVLGNDQGIYEVGKIENEIENSPGIISFSKIRAQRNSIYQLNFKTGQLFGNLVRGIQNNVERQRSDVRNTLEKIKVDYLKDFGGVFKSDESVFSILFRYPTQEEIKNGAIDGPKLVAKIDKKFYTSLKEQKEKFVNLVNSSIKLKKNFTKTAGYTELVKWLEDNIDLEAWRKNYIERKEKQKNLLESQYSYILDEYERNHTIEQALNAWEYRYNILKSPAALNSNNVSAFINENKWLSADYKKIKSSPSALSAYNAFREIMFNARRVGYIQDLSQISEIPTNITTKNKLAHYYSLVKLHGNLKYLYFNSIPKVLEDMLLKPLESNLALDDIKNGFNNINPITQEEELELPIYMLRDFNTQVGKDGKLKSLKDLDLFKVYEELAFHVINFENLSATEELADAIIMVEESKTLEKQMNAQGNTNENKVKAKEIKTREEILKHAKNFIYYNKTKEKDKTTVFNFSVNKLVEYTKSYAAALYLGANHAIAFKAFTASTLSAFSNAGDIYSKRDVLFSPLRRIVSSNLIEKSFNYHVSSSNLHENRLKNNNYAKKAAVYGKEYLFNSLTVVDYEIQKNLFFAALPNFTIIEENGVKKIVNIDKYVDDKYPNIFEETPQKRKEIFKKKDEEKEKLRKNSLVEQLQERAKKIKAGDMSIDLSDIDTESIDKFTNKVQEGAKRVLGNMSDKDIYLWKTGNLPSLLTQFKGFAFKIFDVRWGGIKYNAALERWTYGKMSALSNFLLTKEQVIDENNQEILKTKFTFLSTIIRFLQISAPFLNVKKNEQVIQILKIKYLQYATDAKNKNETVMSEREYMEMYLAELTSAKNELYILVVFAGLFAFAAGGDDDDDDPWLKYLKNIIRGVTKELLFPYSPNQLSSMVVLSFPGLGALTALFNAISFQLGGIIEFTEDSPAYVKVDPFKYTVGERLSPIVKATPYVRPISALLAEYNADWRKFLDVDKKSRSLVKNRLK